MIKQSFACWLFMFIGPHVSFSFPFRENVVKEMSIVE